jgi:hypothetical protein
MRMRDAVRGPAAAVALVLLASSSAIGGSATPEDVVYDVVRAYLDGDVDAYMACLAEDFVFVLYPGAETMVGDTLPGSWDRTDEERIHRRMFEGAPGFAAEPDFRDIRVEFVGEPAAVSHSPGLVEVLFNVKMDVWLSGRPAPAETAHTLYLRPSSEAPRGWEIVRWIETKELPDESVWEVAVHSEGRLYWYGHEFSGEIVFALDGFDLTVNGRHLPLHESLSQANASDRARGMLRPDLAEQQIERIVGYLQRGFDVWVHGFKVHARLPEAEGELPSWAMDDMNQPLQQ